MRRSGHRRGGHTLPIAWKVGDPVVGKLRSLQPRPALQQDRPGGLSPIHRYINSLDDGLEQSWLE
jgi:hypothetical protein